MTKIKVLTWQYHVILISIKVLHYHIPNIAEHHIPSSTECKKVMEFHGIWKYLDRLLSKCTYEWKATILYSMYNGHGPWYQATAKTWFRPCRSLQQLQLQKGSVSHKSPDFLEDISICAMLFALLTVLSHRIVCSHVWITCVSRGSQTSGLLQSLLAWHHESWSYMFIFSDLGCPRISYHSLLYDPGLPARINHGL